MNMITSVNTNFRINSISFTSKNVRTSEPASDTFTRSLPMYNIQVRHNRSIPLTQSSVWALYDDDRFTDFLESDDELQKPFNGNLETLKMYGLKPSLTMFLQDRIQGTDEFLELVKKRYGVDLEEQPKIYRFVGEEEVKNLFKDREVKPQRYCGKFDVTTNPELDWNQYRITFKPNEKFSLLDEKNSKIQQNRGRDKKDYYYLEAPSYDMQDILRIERLTENGYENIQT